MLNEYANEKLRQLDDERLNQTLIAVRMQKAEQNEPSRGKPVIGPALRLAGRTLRRAGGSLERWAEPPAPDTEGVHLERRSW